MKKRIGMAVLLLAALTVPALADDVSGTLYYTTFNPVQNANVWKVNFNYNGTTFTLNPSTSIALTNGADGLLFLPDGNLAVAGQGSDAITEVNPTTGTQNPQVAAGTGSYHLGLGPGSTPLLYNMWNGSGGGGSTAISALQVTASGGISVGGTAYTCGANSTDCDVRGVIFDPATGKWYYSSAPDGAVQGHAGVIVFNDTTHTFTTTAFLGVTGGENLYWAHGISYDPFTQDLIVNGGPCIQQLSATGTLLSQVCSSGEQFDQAAEDGNGHLFVASNSGDLFFDDYDATGLIGAGTNFTSDQFLNSFLDDIAPIAGLGGTPTPEPSTLVLLLGGLAAGARLRRRN